MTSINAHEDNITSSSRANIIPDSHVESSSKSCSSSGSNNNASISKSQRRKNMFGDCALVEIIHLHDCLRGALRTLQRDVTELSRTAALQNKLSGSISNQSTTAGELGTHSICTIASENVTKVAPTEEDIQSKIGELERRVAGRFKVIWSVFRAHSAAEDEFIWPALQEKLTVTSNSRNSSPRQQSKPAPKLGEDEIIALAKETERRDSMSKASESINLQKDGEIVPDASAQVIEKEEYEEDHVNEERMFLKMDSLLAKLRAGLRRKDDSSSVVGSNIDSHVQISEQAITPREKETSSLTPTSSTNASSSICATPTNNSQKATSVPEMADAIQDLANNLSQHLMQHLEKEEVQCMPLVVKHLNEKEINDLVGNIMGKRSSDTMGQILNMAIQTLPAAEKEEMVQYMKQAMVGTFFERWLAMEGFWSSSTNGISNSGGSVPSVVSVDSINSASGEKKSLKRPHNDMDDRNTKIQRQTVLSPIITTPSTENQTNPNQNIMFPPGSTPPLCGLVASSDTTSTAKKENTCMICAKSGKCLMPPAVTQNNSMNELAASGTSNVTQQEMQKLIRAIAANPELSGLQKTTTIQGLRDSVWKSNQRKKQVESESDTDNDAAQCTECCLQQIIGRDGNTISLGEGIGVPPPQQQVQSTRGQRITPPSSYYKKNADGKVVLVWSSDSLSMNFPTDQVPLFSASELAPTYHDGATAAVLGCPHYARSCKLRHPSSGRLYTCRLCCEQEREMPLKDQDSPLDRYAVKELLCMRCGALQPADDHCVNPKCESRGKPYAKNTCKICNLYDDGPNKQIYHCPFCNVCRSGKGLGIDYRHCMRCNACVSLSCDTHVCIPQRLQGNCPICHEAMFESTEPLRGLKCGHVMHLSCFSLYMRGQTYTCPLCKKSVEDMKDYFALLDAAVRMQPMPTAYSTTMSNIYCQDCGKTGKVQYHFVGCKCTYCGSYNTREIERSEDD